MTNPIEAQTYSDAETQARREAALKRMLATPPQPRKASGTRKRVESTKAD